jgi:hypothetical protein
VESILRKFIFIGLLANLIVYFVSLISADKEFDRLLTGASLLLNPFIMFLKLSDDVSLLSRFVECAKVFLMSMTFFMTAGCVRVFAKNVVMIIISWVILGLYYIFSFNVASLYLWNVSIFNMLH